MAVALSLLGGLFVGALGASAIQRTPGGAGGALSATPGASGSADAVPLPPATDDVLLAWTPDRLPPGLLAAAAIPGANAVTVVRGGRADLVGSWTADGTSAGAAPAGLAYPVDVMAFDRRTFPELVPTPYRALFATLGPDDVILGATSARLRGVGAGGSLQFAGSRRFRVAAVVDDETIGAAEVAAAADTIGFGALIPRYLLVRHSAGRQDVETAIRALAGPTRAVRFRSVGETPYLREGDAVLPPVLIKEQFGEFAYRPADGRGIVEDIAWQGENLVDVSLPLLGRIRCHRSLVPALRAAMAELQRRELAGVIVSTADGGCWNPRLTVAGGDISRHAWGAAVDLNVAKNPTGVGSVQDPRLVEVLERCGFTWGGRWLVPDPAHFEYLRPPSAAAC